MPTFGFRKNDKKSDGSSSPKFSPKTPQILKSKLNEAATKGKGLFGRTKSGSDTDNSGRGTSVDDKVSAISGDNSIDTNDFNDEEEHSLLFTAGNSHTNSETGMGKSFGLEESTSSHQSEDDAFFMQGGAKHYQHSKNRINSSERSVPRTGAVSLEAHMSLKYSKATGFSTRWFKAYVILDMDAASRGTIKIYSEKPKDSIEERPAVGALGTPRRKLTKTIHQSTRIGSTDVNFLDQSVLPILEIPAEMRWVSKDQESSSRRFVIEIPSESASMVRSSISKISSKSPKNDMDDSEGADLDATNKSLGMSEGDEADDDIVPPLPLKSSTSSSLLGALNSARNKNQPFRLHFQCLRKGGNEKQVWMTAFEELGRLSFDLHKRVFGFGVKKIKNDRRATERPRVKSDDKFSKQAQKLTTLGKRESETEDSMQESTDIFFLESASEVDISTSIKFSDNGSFSSDDEFSHVPHKLKANFQLTKKDESREFMLHPTYAYPNKWMTHSEIYNEMLKPSLVYHDLRTATETRKEIGTVRVELLECSGLPRLDWGTETDSVVYMVCGSYAFTSDVILDKLNPVWLPRSRRACIFPLFHAFAKVYAGVFDDDGPGQKDDFAGRVVLDLAKCRPGSTYDVALPLRQSSQVYSRRPRGAIRLRFSIDYTSHRSAILSYLPQSKPNFQELENSVTVLCYDEKAFRNITLTVHGEDLPGRFGTKLMKATTRELHFLRKVSQLAVEETILDFIFWKNRTFSALCFLAWMHCCYLNSLGMVPFYFFCFLFLMMMQNYAFYGSNGRVQQGFVPPSFEEMALALLRGKPIEPIHVRPHRDEASALKSEKTVKTHDEKAKVLLDLLGFKSCTEEDQPEDYHMEFPLARSVRHPITEDYLYPKFSMKDCKVLKNTNTNKEEEDDRSYSMDIIAAVSSMQDAQQLTSRVGKAAGNLQAKLGDRLEQGKERLRETKDILEKGEVGNLLSGANVKVDAGAELAAAFQKLPKLEQIQDQNIDVPEISESGKKKKIIEELYGVRNDIHEITKFAFFDKTHTITQKDAIYFGGKLSKNVDQDLDKLLGLGTHATPNPVKSMIAVHMAPMIDAIHGFLHAFRSFVNVVTWHDPILSFLVSLAFFVAAMVSLIFPFRVFFFFVGAVLLGPQNYFFIKHVRPHFREELQAKRRAKRIRKLAAAKKGKVHKEIPTNQPIITSHTSDNSPPLNLSMDEVDKRGIHQVCVPYSPLTYRRDNYWPPQPEYGRCDPHTRLYERSMARMRTLSQRKSMIGLPQQRRNLSE